MNKSDSIANLAAALCKAQSELSNPKKTSANPFFKSRYADLSEVINVSKPILAEHGLSVIQLLTFTDCVHVETILLHSTGEYISETLSLPVLKQDAQTIGAVATYSRRYSWAAICGLAQEDDDGNTATGKTASQSTPYKAPPKSTEPKQEKVDNAVCTDETFKKNQQAWFNLVDSGKKSAADLINWLSAKYTLTEAQQMTIESWEQ